MRSDRTDNSTALTVVGHNGNGDGRARPLLEEQSLGELFKRLSVDSTHLMKQEVALAKAEVRESAAKMTRAVVKIGIAVGFALPGAMAVVAALVIGLGIVIHSYWGSALIVGVVLLVVTSVFIRRAIAELESGLAPTETMRSVREDADWAKKETTRVKQELSA